MLWLRKNLQQKEIIQCCLPYNKNKEQNLITAKIKWKISRGVQNVQHSQKKYLLH